MLEIEKGAKELSIPNIRANRRIVANTNGGLHYPSSLAFNSEWRHEETHDDFKRFNYPSVSGVTLPENEEDIAFMTVSWLSLNYIQTSQNMMLKLYSHFLMSGNCGIVYS